MNTYPTVKFALSKPFDFQVQNLPPIHVRLELTENCNLQCNFCVWHNPVTKRQIEHTVDMKGRHWNPERGGALLSELKILGTECVSFTGAGDPLLYPHIGRILETCHDIGLRVGLTSNFSMQIDDLVLEQLSRCEWLRWSQNVSCEESHNIIHQSKAPAHSHTRAKGNVTKLLSLLHTKKKPQILKSSIVVNELTTPYIERIVRTAIEIGVHRISFRPDVPLFSNECVSYSKEQLKEFQRLNELELTNKIAIDYSEDRDEFISYDSSELNGLKCLYSSVSTYIAANFDVYPCCYTRIDKRYIIGNVSNISFDQFWKSKSRRQSPKSIVVEHCPPCPHVTENIALRNALTQSKIPAVNPNVTYAEKFF